MTKPLLEEDRERADVGGDDAVGAPVLAQDPPSWIVRTGAWIAMVTFAATVLGSILVRLPDVVEAPFVLASADGAPPRARILLDERNLLRFAAGQRVRLEFTAYPPSHFGTVTGVLERVGTSSEVTPIGTGFVGTAVLETSTIGARETGPLRAGMHGTARIIVGDRSIAQVLLGLR